MSAQAIEVVQNLVLDTIQPFVQRLNDLEQTVLDFSATPAPAVRDDEPNKEVVRTAQPGDVLQERLDKIIDMHVLDAVPALWQFVGGKREQAPEGLWEITCRVCKDHMLTWKQGDPEPQRCKTVRAAQGF